MEIERKFAAKRDERFFDDIFGTVDLISIEQFYTEISDEREVRYRMTPTSVTKTIKTGSGLSREEIETDCDSDEYMEQQANIVGNYIEKERVIVDRNGHRISIDQYSRPPMHGWSIIEVEFDTEEEALEFTLPGDLLDAFDEIVEVTDDKRYKNKNIALYGFPIDLKSG
jgi:CYTH domain-containing protein